MKINLQSTPASTTSGIGLDRSSYARQRLRHFGLSMIVMGISFSLYYLGLFGRVDGPLNPSQLGAQMAAWGMSKNHILSAVTAMTLLALVWNWIYNLMSFLLGTRRTCDRTDAHGTVCRNPVERKKITIAPQQGRKEPRYVCELGHRRTTAQFHPLKKGTVAQMLWVISLVLTAIVFYSTYG